MPEPEEITCSVLVPVLNEAAGIERAVASICAQQLEGELEVLLIDGGSRDGTRELLSQLSAADARVRVLENPSGRIPVALNIGLAHARGRWIARMDAHSAFAADYAARGIARLRAGGASWVSGPQLPVGYNGVSRAVELALGGWLGSGPSRRWASRQDAGECQLDSGVFCGVWSRAVLEAIGGWDERWDCNEDSEMAGRFLERGARLVCLPAMVAHYTPRGSLAALWRQYRRYGEFRVRTAIQHPLTLRRSHLFAPLLLICALAALLPWGVADIPGRAVLALYAGALALSAGQAWRRAGSVTELALVPLVLMTMHVAHGYGFWRGTSRWGPPAAAVIGLVRHA